MTERGTFVTVHWPAGQVGIDGQAEAAAIVVKVYDDGTINAKVLSPMSSAEWFMSGLKPEAQWTLLEGADKNVPYFA